LVEIVIRFFIHDFKLKIYIKHKWYDFVNGLSLINFSTFENTIIRIGYTNPVFYPKRE